MNVNKALWIVCGTAVIICLLLILRPLIPERTTSTERVLMQPERTTSTERVETNRIATTERIFDKQRSAVEIAQSNAMALQVQQQIDAQLRLSNYNVAKAELAAEWLKLRVELLKKKTTDQSVLNLANMELKGRIAAKYGVSLDSSEPTVPTISAPAPVVVIQPPSTPLTLPRQSTSDAFRRRYGISPANPSPPPTRSKPNSTVLALLKQQYAQAEQKMWALEQQGKGYAKQPDGSVMFYQAGRWVKVDPSRYEPEYDSIRFPKDALQIRIQQLEHQ